MVDERDFRDCVFELANTWVEDMDGDDVIDKEDFLIYLQVRACSACIVCVQCVGSVVV